MNLSTFEARSFALIARVLMPATVFGGITRDRDVARELSYQQAVSPWYAALVVRLAIWLVWFAPPFVIGRMRTFGGLDGEARVACLEKLMKSDLYLLRELIKLLKLNTTLALLGDVGVLKHIGVYDLGDYRLVDERGGLIALPPRSHESEKAS